MALFSPKQDKMETRRDAPNPVIITINLGHGVGWIQQDNRHISFACHPYAEAGTNHLHCEAWCSWTATSINSSITEQVLGFKMLRWSRNILVFHCYCGTLGISSSSNTKRHYFGVKVRVEDVNYIVWICNSRRKLKSLPCASWKDANCLRIKILALKRKKPWDFRINRKCSRLSSKVFYANKCTLKVPCIALMESPELQNSLRS